VAEAAQLCAPGARSDEVACSGTFARQALPMVWDYAEANPFANSSGNLIRMAELVADVLEQSCSNGLVAVRAIKSMLLRPSQNSLLRSAPTLHTTTTSDYADLSDFFYVWLRKSRCEHLS